MDEVLGRAGIDDIGDRRVGKCSGGQQQRLRFAMALLPDPELLILDEPTTGMDVTGRRDFWNAIHEDAARGRTVVFATHYLEEADAYADRIVLISQGRVVADGTASEVKSLVSGRTIRATLDGADPGGATVRDIRCRCGGGARGHDPRHLANSDSVARHLLTTTDARDLEITTRGLEDAFISLTSDGDDMNATATNPATHRDHRRGIDRRVPPMGGLNSTLLKLEVRRLLRNRRTLVFAVIMPVAFFLIFGTGKSYSDEDAGHGNVAAFIMISMALYGAMLTDQGRHHGVRRAEPRVEQAAAPHPAHLHGIHRVKVVVAMLLGAVSVAVTYVAGALGGSPDDGPHSGWSPAWRRGWGPSCSQPSASSWGTSCPARTSCRCSAPCSPLRLPRRLFLPLDQGDLFRIAKVTPMYGLNELCPAPLTGDRPGGPPSPTSPSGWCSSRRGGMALQPGHRTGLSGRRRIGGRV